MYFHFYFFFTFAHSSNISSHEAAQLNFAGFTRVSWYFSHMGLSHECYTHAGRVFVLGQRSKSALVPWVEK